MRALRDMTKNERSLLLYFETRAVDYGGRVSTAHMNADDVEIAQRWNDEGFVRFGRIASEYTNGQGTHWCALSEEAWTRVHAERKARAFRGRENRSWKTTEEKRNDQ